MIIGIDFDGTFAAAPECFRRVVEVFHAEGHRCVIVTGRSGDGELGAEVRRAVGDLMPIVFAGRAWKREAAKSAGYHVDVWIDDNPEFVALQPPIIGGAT